MVINYVGLLNISHFWPKKYKPLKVMGLYRLAHLTRSPQGLMVGVKWKNDQKKKWQKNVNFCVLINDNNISKITAAACKHYRGLFWKHLWKGFMHEIEKRPICYKNGIFLPIFQYKSLYNKWTKFRFFTPSRSLDYSYPSEFMQGNF